MNGQFMAGTNHGDCASAPPSTETTTPVTTPPSTASTQYAAQLTINTNIDDITDKEAFGNVVLDDIAVVMEVARANLELVGVDPGSVVVNFKVKQSQGAPVVDLQAALGKLEVEVASGNLVVADIAVDASALSYSVDKSVAPEPSTTTEETVTAEIISTASAIGFSSVVALVLLACNIGFNVLY